MSITATELKSNLGKYLLLSATEDVYITRNGKIDESVSGSRQLRQVSFRCASRRNDP